MDLIFQEHFAQFEFVVLAFQVVRKFIRFFLEFRPLPRRRFRRNRNEKFLKLDIVHAIFGLRASAAPPSGTLIEQQFRRKIAVTPVEGQNNAKVRPPDNFACRV